MSQLYAKIIYLTVLMTEHIMYFFFLIILESLNVSKSSIIIYNEF
jgi:hypothetical protein